MIHLLQDCAEQCATSADCGAWYLEVANGTNDYTCYLKVRASIYRVTHIVG